MIQVITIEREYGSGAAAIAARLAARLGWTLWDQMLTEEIARLAHCERGAVERREERRDPLYYRLLKSFALGSYEGSRGAPIEMLDADSIVKISQQVVEGAADAGNCVIVGRGSQHFLRDRNDSLRFFLYASKQEKVRRLVSEEGIRQEDAERLVDTVDHERSAFIRDYFHADWPNRSIYHAMFNTDAGEQVVIRAILNFLRRSQATDPAAD